MSAVLLSVEQLRRRVPGGIGTYAENLVLALAGLDGTERPEVVLHASRSRTSDDPLDALGLPLVGSKFAGQVLTRLWDLGLSWVARDYSLVHATSLAAPPPWGRPLAVTVHDLAWRTVPETFPRRGRHWHEAALRRAKVRASAFVVPSRETAEALVTEGVGPDRVTVVPHGADHLPAPDRTGTSRLLASLGVAGPYLLAVGTLEPRKNLPRLFGSYAMARSSLPEPWPLVVVGPGGWGPGTETVPGVLLAGYVAPAVLAGLYENARCTAYVPLVEGFGLPAVESMRAGTPVVASPIPSTAGAALEVDPRDEEVIAEGLVSAATDGPVRDQLVAAGSRRVAGLTWRAAAEGHVRLWRRLLAGGPAAEPASGDVTGAP